MPILTARQQIAIKQEATAGTLESLVAADVVQHTGTAEFEADWTMTPREAMSSVLSPRGSVRGSRMGRIRFKMYLGGSYNHTTGASAAVAAGTEAPWHVPMLGCGAASTISGGAGSEQNSYKPSSTTIKDETTGAYCTIRLYEDGKAYTLIGAVGNCVLTLQTGMPVLAEFEFTGRSQVNPADASLLVPVYSDVIEPPFLNASLTVLSYATPYISRLTLDLGNEIAMRPDPNGTSGFFTAQIVRRNPRGTLDPEETLAATKNWWAEWSLGTVGSITTGVFDGTNNNSLSLTIPNASYTKVGLADREGVANAPLEFECRANSDAGDDEWELVQT